ncbi:hypothetical protein, partial [Pseudomonas amygdali]|uniref:hypothetical protein n=1 Tax=Pseudomonas amygdali TaxID=47877 RepID=UPI001F2F1900
SVFAAARHNRQKIEKIEPHKSNTMRSTMAKNSNPANYLPYQIAEIPQRPLPWSIDVTRLQAHWLEPLLATQRHKRDQ